VGTVDLEKITEPEDEAFVRNLIEEFQEKTGSDLAAKILQEWTLSTKRFIKVTYINLA